MPNNGVSAFGAKSDAERLGLTNLGFNLAIRKLEIKKFIVLNEIYDDNNNQTYDGIYLENDGWKWIENNENRFLINKTKNKNQSELPF